MHITFRLVLPGRDRSIRLPSANLHLFQSMLYALLPPDEASFLHDDGYEAGGKKLKLFAMSWPAAASMPSFEGEGRKKKLILPAPVRLTISTPMHNLAMSFIEGALSKGELRVGNNPLFCGRVEVERPNAGCDTMVVNTLSPITCYETVRLRGHSYTIFFKPDEREFQRSVHDNLLHKFRALFPDREAPEGEFHITPLGNVKERVSFFDPRSGFPIKGWWGRFRLHGPKELLQIALDCGLGAKNSAGWGCVAREEPENFERPMMTEDTERRQKQNEDNSDNLRDKHTDERCE